MQKEIWKEVPKFFGKYLVSNMGRVKHYKKGIMNQHDNGKGYKTVGFTLCGNSYTKSVHRLVCECFLPNPDNKPQVNHKNYKADDNRLENLEWVTAKENMRHSCKRGRRNQDEYNPNRANLLQDEVRSIREDYANGERTVKEMSEQHGISGSSIYKIINGESYAYL